MSKRQKREARKEGLMIGNNIQKTGFTLKKITPMTESQQDAFEAFDDGYNLLFSGFAGTGKTFLSLYFGLRGIEEGNFRKVMIVRSIVSARDIGFLPGTLDEKIKVYEAPYRDIVNTLYGRGDTYQTLKSKGVIEFVPTSFQRGITINDTLILVDEMQNLSGRELNTVITRMGKNSKIIFCGDYFQSDLLGRDKNDILKFIQILEAIDCFAIIDFNAEDIVRSKMIKDYLIAKQRIGHNLDW